MTIDELTISLNTTWILVCAALVLLMQVGFVLLEAGLVRARNAAHVAAKTLLVLAVSIIVFWLVGFGIAFGDRAPGVGAGLSGFMGTSGFAPSTAQLLHIGGAPFSTFGRVSTAGAWWFQAVFAAVAAAIAFGGMAERARLATYVVFGVMFTLAYSVVAHWVWHPDGWLAQMGMLDFAGSTVVHYQGALAALVATVVLGARLGSRDQHGRLRQLHGHNLPLVIAGTGILWVGWMGFNPGSTLGVENGGLGFAAYVALTTNLGAAAGVAGAACTAWILRRRVDIPALCNGALAALVAVTAACGFVAPWAALLIGATAGVIAVTLPPLVERIGIDDPIAACSVHGAAGVWGTLATGMFATPALTHRLGVGSAGVVYSGDLHQLGVQALGLLITGAFGIAVFATTLLAMRSLGGIRVSRQVELMGLDLAEHGVHAYPELTGMDWSRETGAVNPAGTGDEPAVNAAPLPHGA